MLPPTTPTATDERVLRCGPAALAAAIVLLEGPFGPTPLATLAAPEVAELAACGAMDGTSLAPWAARLADVVARPRLHATVLAVDEQGRFTLHQLWARPDHAAAGRADGSGAAIRAVDPRRLDAALFALLEVDPASAEAPAEIAPEAGEFLACLLVGDLAGAGAAAMAAPDPAPFAALLAGGLRSWWIDLAALEPDDGFDGPRRLAVLDAPPLGCWLVHDGGPDLPRPRPEPASGPAIREAVARLLRARHTSPTDARTSEGTPPWPSRPIPSCSPATATSPTSSPPA